MVLVTIHVAILFNLSFVVSYVSTIKVKQLWGASSAISPTFDSVFLSWAFILARFEGVGVERGDVSHLSIFLQCICLHPWTRSRGQNQQVMENTRNRSKFELNEEPTSIRQGTRFKSPITQELETEVVTPRQLTCYGSASQEHWNELANYPQHQDFLLEECFQEVWWLDPADLSLQDETAEGGQANVFFAAYDKFSTPVVVKRLKYGQVDLLKLRRRLDKVMRLVREHSSAICKVMGVGTGNLDNAWILMERMGGDLRNFIDHGVRYVGYVDDGHGWAYAVWLQRHYTHEDDDGHCTRDGGPAQLRIDS